MKTVYLYRGTEYPTKYEAMSAARDEARARCRSVQSEVELIHKVRREGGAA